MVVDLETTGLAPQKGDRIVEIGAVRVVDGVLEDRFQTLVNPRRPIPYYAQKVHGISDSMVKDAPFIESALLDFLRFAGEDALVSHNARFDRGFLDCCGEEPLVHPHFDTVILSRKMIPGLRSYGLDSLIQQLSLPIEDRHRALGDAEATAKLLVHLLSLGGEAQLPACRIK